MTKIVAITLLWVVTSLAGPAAAATLGLSTDLPQLEASDAEVDYVEFGPRGSLLTFGAVIDTAGGVSPSGLAELGFAIGFRTDDPVGTAMGFFFVDDEDGLFLDGLLTAVGFTEDVIELQFDSLAGPVASLFGPSALMVIDFDAPLGPNPFAALTSGSTYEVSVRLARVVPDTPAPIPVPAALPLLGFALLAFGGLARRRI